MVLTSCSITAPFMLSSSLASMRLLLDSRLQEGSFDIRDSHRMVHMAGRISLRHQLRRRAATAEAPQHNQLPLPALLLTLSNSVQHCCQVASVVSKTVLHTDGYRSHPAVVDGCLHLAASIIRPNRGATPIAVPVTVQSFSTGPIHKPPVHTKMLATCHFSSVAADGLSMSNHSLEWPPPAASAAFDIVGLEARPLNITASTIQLPLFFNARGMAPSIMDGERLNASNKGLQLTYHVLWEAESIAGHYTQNKDRWSLPSSAITMAFTSSSTTSSQEVGIKAGNNDASSVCYVLSNMQQQAVVSQYGTQTGVVTCGGMQCGPSAVGSRAIPSSYAAWGIARVAASEVVETRWALADLDNQAVDSQRAAGEAVDTSGSMVRNGVALRPLLLPSSAHEAWPTVHAFAMTRGTVLVTGGLGGKKLVYERRVGIELWLV